MAEKKVRKLVHDSDRKKVSKKTIITSSVIVAVLAVVGAIVGLLFGLGVFNKEAEKYTYFTEFSSNKLNTVEILNRAQKNEHVFLFVYNNDEFDAKAGENDTEFDENDQAIVEQIAQLAKIIEEKNAKIPNNEKGDKNLYFLYLVDTSIEGNEKIYEDASLGNITDAEDPALTYFYKGANYTSVPEDLENKLNGNRIEDYTITYKGTNKKALIQCLKDSKSFIQDLVA